MNTLYIIGNGFDRYHGLDTRYQAFAFFLQDNYPQIYERFIEYYGLPDLDRDDADDQNDPLWADFERALAVLDFESVLDDNTNYLPDYSSDEFRDRDWHSYEIAMEGIVDDLTDNLFNAFKEFILQVELPVSVEDKLLHLPKNAVYLNFNYTSTLERYYEIPANQICYIHKRADDLEAVLILGHGVDPVNFVNKLPEPPTGLNEEQLEEWREQQSDNYDYAFESGREELMTYFKNSFKDTSKVIEENSELFNGLSEVGRVVVLGHSMSDVDQPYFMEILKSVGREARWCVSFYGASARDALSKNLNALGIEDRQVYFFRIQELGGLEP